MNARGPTRPRGAALAAALAGALAGEAGCNTVLGLHEKQLEAPPDAPSPPRGDAAGDASGEGPTSCAFDDTGAGDLRSPGCWSTFEMTAASAAFADAPGSEGAAFDGRYVYLAPAPGALAARYDTTAPFTAPGSWSTFDVKARLGIVPRFSGATFDGRYVTFVPYDTSPLVVRFDTTASFDAAASWSTFDPTALDPNANGFSGATFDGQFEYLVPRRHSVLLRRDTRAAAAGAGWEKFDVAQVQSTTLTAFWGGVFDGTSVYFAPEGDGVVVRYDRSKPFASPLAWSKFDTVVFHPLHLSFVGGAFDGRFVYFGPGGPEDFVVRFDAQGTFTDAASWAAVDLRLVSPSLGPFSGAAFDGRFVYFTPTGSLGFGGAPNRRLARFDTRAPFEAEGSWTIFDVGAVGAGPVGGSVFDGRFLYLLPARGRTTVARFEARRSAKVPALPAFFGSFF